MAIELPERVNTAEPSEERAARERAIEAFKARGGRTRQMPPRMAYGSVPRQFAETKESLDDRWAETRDRVLKSPKRK